MAKRQAFNACYGNQYIEWPQRVLKRNCEQVCPVCEGYYEHNIWSSSAELNDLWSDRPVVSSLTWRDLNIVERWSITEAATVNHSKVAPVNVTEIEPPVQTRGHRLLPRWGLVRGRSVIDIILVLSDWGLPATQQSNLMKYIGVTEVLILMI